MAMMACLICWERHVEASMEGILFMVMWIGGAAIHTLVELRLRNAGGTTGRQDVARLGKREKQL